jgi:hypothetical protein
MFLRGIVEGRLMTHSRCDKNDIYMYLLSSEVKGKKKENAS